MKSALSTGMILFLIAHITIAQYGPTSKVNTILYQTFRDMDNPDSWIHKDYTYHHYNGKGLLESSVRYRHFQNDKTKIIKISELKYQYDFHGRLIESENLHFNSSTGKLTSVTRHHLTYTGDMIIRSESNLQYVQDNYSYTEIHLYDLDGNLIEKTDISDYGVNQITTRTRYYIWDENGCLVETTFITDDSSSKTVNMLTESCETLETRQYELDGSSMEYLLSLTQKWEVEYDDHGNKIRETGYQKIEGIDTTFNILSEDLYYYDERNRDTLQVHLNRYGMAPDATIYKARSYTRYDENDNIIYAYSEYWDEKLNKWIPGDETSNEYNDDYELIHSMSFEIYSLEEDKFLSYYESRFERDKATNETYSYFKEEDLSRDPPYYSEREQREQYACDERPLKYATTDLIHRTGYTYEFSYFDQPECDKFSLPLDEILVFPNPARDYIHFKMTDTIEEITIGIYDLSGRMMQSKSYNTSDFYSIDVSTLLKGMYVLKITIEDETLIDKFLKI